MEVQIIWMNLKLFQNCQWKIYIMSVDNIWTKAKNISLLHLPHRSTFISNMVYQSQL